MIRTGRDDLRALWRRLGIATGANILCHSFLGALGRIDGGPQAVAETLLEAVGEGGTLIAPTFTYSYFKDEIYDPAETPSTVGILGDILRRHDRGFRNLDPNFSNAGVGPLAEKLLTLDGSESFGATSPYARFIDADIRILLLGVDYTALPLFMHLEAKHGVPYRHPKSFHGRLRIAGELKETVAVHHVRDAGLNPQSDRRRIGAFIDREPEVVLADLPYGVARMTSARVVERVVARELRRDPLILLDASRPFQGDGRK
ncbi:MAG: AAC(3) family N-acetyltransferase [Alphaproteobacteria bacterium]|nr:AAC(3) family N-acetyltransferase [Alphaproteobacteria bacterium]